MACPSIRFPLLTLWQGNYAWYRYDPSRQECFSAQAGKGAWLNDQPIHPSPTPDLDHALLVTGFPYDIRTNAINNLDHYAHLALHSQGVRRLGSAALDLCNVACGRLDGFWELRLNSWDVAAGGLIAREAGAVVTNLRGQTFSTPIHPDRQPATLPYAG
jgi:myo-inositol-1(or 4)-monophosphatase